MIKKTAKLIHRLRVYFLLSFSIAFMFLIGLSPVDVGKFVGAHWGKAVGFEVGVPDNPFNRLALQLKEKEQSLDIREKELEEREKNLLAPNKRQDVLILLMGVGILILFVLIATNYYLDFHRRKEKDSSS